MPDNPKWDVKEGDWIITKKPKPGEEKKDKEPEKKPEKK